MLLKKKKIRTARFQSQKNTFRLFMSFQPGVETFPSESDIRYADSSCTLDKNILNTCFRIGSSE